jgi:hypothetical protein
MKGPVSLISVPVQSLCSVPSYSLHFMRVYYKHFITKSVINVNFEKLIYRKRYIPVLYDKGHKRQSRWSARV